MKTAAGTKAVWAKAGQLALALVCLGAGIAHAVDTDANSAKALRAKYGVLQGQLSLNSFHRPLYLDSGESADGVTGGIYALVNYPLATVEAALASPGNWCDILILHVNTKYCRASRDGRQDVLNVSIGRRFDQPLEEAYRVAFAYRVGARTPTYLQVKLSADEGPLSTSDYRLVLDAVELENGQTFIHFSYSYTYGLVGRVAMQVYLGTIGKAKVGFSVSSTLADGQPIYIGGMRGLVERNTMRYYLAIDAFLGALSVPPEARFEKRLHDWFAGIEMYPRQLHEMEQGAYFAMKRKEYRRQHAEVLGSGAD